MMRPRSIASTAILAKIRMRAFGLLFLFIIGHYHCTDAAAAATATAYANFLKLNTQHSNQRRPFAANESHCSAHAHTPPPPLLPFFFFSCVDIRRRPLIQTYMLQFNSFSFRSHVCVCVLVWVARMRSVLF